MRAPPVRRSRTIGRGELQEVRDVRAQPDMRRGRLAARTSALVAVATVLTLAAAIVVIGQVSADDETLYGCVHNRNGTLRVVAEGTSCRTNEEASRGTVRLQSDHRGPAAPLSRPSRRSTSSTASDAIRPGLPRAGSTSATGRRAPMVRSRSSSPASRSPAGRSLSPLPARVHTDGLPRRRPFRRGTGVTCSNPRREPPQVSGFRGSPAVRRAAQPTQHRSQVEDRRLRRSSCARRLSRGWLKPRSCVAPLRPAHARRQARRR